MTVLGTWTCKRCSTLHNWKIRKPKRCRHCGYNPETEAIMAETTKKFSNVLKRLADK